jgi:hypothetical protein
MPGVTRSIGGFLTRKPLRQRSAEPNPRRGSDTGGSAPPTALAPQIALLDQAAPAFESGSGDGAVKREREIERPHANCLRPQAQGNLAPSSMVPSLTVRGLQQA